MNSSSGPSLFNRIAFAIGSVGTDLRIGARMLAKEKSFCAIAVGVLALGIGAVTTQFAVVNGVLLRGFSFPHADRLATIELSQQPVDSASNFNSRFTPADFVDFKAQQTSFDAFSCWLLLSAANVNLNGHTERRNASYVTHEFFRVLGVKPALGRDFTEADDQDGVAPAVIISHQFWRDEFGADPNVIGRPIRVNGRAGTVIGVMPRGFTFPYDEQLWTSLRSESPVRPRHEHANRSVTIYARLKPGVTFAQASAEMMLIAERLSKLHPENATLKFARVRPLLDVFTSPQTTGLLYTLLAFSAGVLLIACVNVANLQFARATQRMRELAIRASFGATRIRLLRQLLTENLLLALGGAISGALLAVWAIDWLDTAMRGFATPLPEWMHFTVDGPVLGVIVTTTVLATVGSGLLPGLAAVRAGLAAELKEGSRGTTSRRTGALAHGLVIFQIVVTCVLLIGSLLQLRSMMRQQQIDHGYDTTGVLTARCMLMPGDYPTSESRLRFYERLLRDLREHQTLAAAAFTDHYRMLLPASGSVEIEGQPASSDAERLSADSARVTDGYFATLGQRLLAGRDFTAEDNDLQQPVAIVNATFARLYFPKGNAVGSRFRPVNPNPKTPEPWRVIVGVVSDARLHGPFPRRTQDANFYLPFSALLYTGGKPVIDGMQYVTIVVRPRGQVRPETSLAGIRETIRKINPDLPIYYIGTPQAQFATFLGQTRLIMLLSLAVGGIAVVLASAGLYGVTSHGVNRRQKEFGIRIALGADRRQLLALVLKQAGSQVAWGLAIGLAVTAVTGVIGRSSIGRALFETNPLDPLTYTAVALLLAAVAFVATLVPARRATRVNPIEALRAE